MIQSKRAQVIMLPSNNDGQGIYLSPITTINKLHYTTKRILNSYIAQHLYIISDDEIKEGDYVVNTKDNHYGGIVNKNNLIDARLLTYIKKIISTTDISLRIYYPCVQCDGTGETTFSGTYTTQKKCDLCSQLKYPNTKALPQPSQQFIEKYIESYNKGEVITDLLVEYDWEFIGDNPLIDNYQGSTTKLKVNPKDNTTTIIGSQEQ